MHPTHFFFYDTKFLIEVTLLIAATTNYSIVSCLYILITSQLCKTYDITRSFIQISVSSNDLDNLFV